MNRYNTVSAAQQRVLAAEMDRAIAEVMTPRPKKDERDRGAREEPSDIQTQASACDRRVQELEAEQKQNYLTVFESYPEIRESTAAVAIALAKLLDKVWSSITRFEAESGLPLEGKPFVTGGHRLDLTPEIKVPKHLPSYPYAGGSGEDGRECPLLHIQIACSPAAPWCGWCSLSRPVVPRPHPCDTPPTPPRNTKDQAVHGVLCTFPTGVEPTGAMRFLPGST